MDQRFPRRSLRRGFCGPLALSRPGLARPGPTDRSDPARRSFMTHPPGAGRCQGNFAATVKEILPIYESGAPAAPTRTPALPRELLRIDGNRSLTGRVIVAKLDLHEPGRPGGPHAPTPGLQRRIAPSARRLEPPPPEGGRPLVPPRRVLRPARPGAGQVRDAAPRPRRGVRRHRGHSGLRVLPSRLLSGPGALPPRRPAGLDPATTRTPSCPQTLRPHRRFPAPTPASRSVAPSRRARGAGSRAVRPRGPSPQHRTRLGAPTKKSPLIPEVPRDQVPVLPDELWTPRYEAMRKRAMAKSGSVDNSYGYALLIRRGLVAWMKAWPRPAREPPHDLGSGPRADALTVPSHLLQSAASLLVNMILSLGAATEVPYEQ